MVAAATTTILLGTTITAAAADSDNFFGGGDYAADMFGGFNTGYDYYWQDTSYDSSAFDWEFDDTSFATFFTDIFSTDTDGLDSGSMKRQVVLGLHPRRCVTFLPTGPRPRPWKLTLSCDT